MPEGHTLRRLALELTEVFGGRLLAVSSPQGRFAAEAAVLDSSVFTAADSAGKHLFCEFEGGRIVHVHLGLIGGFAIHREVTAIRPPVGQVRLRLATTAVAGQGSGLAYADLRGATRCDLVGPERRTQVVASLGPDPLRPDADPDRAWRRIRRSPRALGELLMDQQVIAGVGNVYRAEVLFRQRIHPRRPGHSLRPGQFSRIWGDLVRLMADGVATGRIDTVAPEHAPEAMGRPARVDDHGGEVYVYRRAGQPCLRCSAAVRTEVLAGRNVFWCPRCQPPFRSRSRTVSLTRAPTRGLPPPDKDAGR